MKSRHPAGHGGGEADELERLVDEGLRSVGEGRRVDLRARVLAAIDSESADARDAAGPWALAWWPAVTLAAAIALAVSVLVVSRPGERRFWANDGGGAAATATTTPKPRPGFREPGGSRHTQPGVAGPLAATGAGQGAQGARRAAAGGRTAARRAWLERLRESTPGAEAALVLEETLAAATEPYSPGAPAGDLGDPLQPLPVPPPIAIPPITQSPIEAGALISDVSRPVTEFTTDDTEPGARSRDAGRSGGSSR